MVPLAAAQEPVYEAGEPGLDPPRLLPDSRVEPRYPDEAIREGVSGTVILRVVVDDAGAVSSVEVFRHPYRGEVLALAAMEAVHSWRYQPARLDGRPVSCRIMTTVPFTLPGAGRRKVEPRSGKKQKQSKKERKAAAAKSKSPRSVPVDVEAEPAAVVPIPLPEPQAAPVAPEAEEKPPARDAGPPANAVPVRPSPEAAEPPGRRVVPPEEPPSLPPSRPIPQEPPPAVTPEPERATPPAPAPPANRPATGPPPVIEIRRGGHGDLVLGQSAERARQIVKELAGAPAPAGEGPLQVPGQGLEVRLITGADGEVVGAIRYLFRDQDGVTASPLRTRKGIGRGSLCMGVIPAYGRPDRREAVSADDGGSLLRLRYVRGATRAEFHCRDGRLDGLFLTLEDGESPP